MSTQSFANPFKTERPDDEPVIIMTRTLNAPLDLVWTAWTQPEHVVNWWGMSPNQRIVEYDVRKGGKWKIVSSEKEGDFTFFGTYLDVQPKTLIRNTFVVEGMYEEDERFYEEHNFTEQDGKTYYRSFSKLASFEQREAYLGSGMEYGANVSMEKLDAVLEQLKRR